MLKKKKITPITWSKRTCWVLNPIIIRFRCLYSIVICVWETIAKVR